MLFREREGGVSISIDHEVTLGLGYNLIDRGKRFITIKLNYPLIEER
jgi:hypothetical protein